MNVLAETKLCSVVSAWETFRSEWYLAAINKDPSAFRVELALQIETAIRSRLGERLSQIAMSGISLPNHFKVSDVRAILDAEGRNLSFTDGAKIAVAMKNLAPTWRVAASKLGKDELRTVVLATKCRNAIAHRSEMSMAEFNKAVKEMVGSRNPYKKLARANSVRRNAIGTYLRARTVPVDGNNWSRAYFICTILSRAAEKFEV
jgi:hypothetical protein